MKRINIYKTRKFGLEVHTVYYQGMFLTQFLSFEYAKTYAMRLAIKLGEAA